VDIFKVVETGISPCADVGVAGAGGGQVGAGVARLPMEVFRDAVAAYTERYGPVAARPA
jgi:hypothetical protein